MLTIAAPRIPAKPMMEDGSPFPTTPPTTNTISIPDGDSDAFWNAVDTVPGGTRIEIAGSFAKPTWRWPKPQNRGNGWVVVAPKPGRMQALDATIGENRVKESDYGLLPTLHATNIAQATGFVFGVNAPM